MNEAKKLVERIAAEAEASAEEPMPTDALPSKPNKAVTVATRLTVEDAAAIDELAARLEVPVSALLRGWILAGLAARQTDTVHGAIDRLSADVQRLRELIA